MSDLTVKRFEPLITWLNYYNAVVEGDTKRVDIALFYYHTDAQTARLDGEDPALVLAARKGRIEIVKQLLEHITFSKIPDEKRDDIVHSALRNCCFNSESHLNICHILLKKATIFVKFDDELLMKCLSCNNPLAVEVLMQGQECPSFLELAVREGHSCIWKNGIVEKKDVKYPSDFSEINKALFVNDKDVVKSLAHEYNCSGSNVTYEDTVLVCDAFKYCVKIGDVKLFEFLRSMFTSNAELSKWMELACDTACEFGQCDIVKMLMRERWVDVTYGRMWKKILSTSVKNDRTNVACYLMDTMFVKQGPVTSVGYGRRRNITVCDPDSEYYKELTEIAVIKRNLVMTEKLIECRSAMYPHLTVKWTEKSVQNALKTGYTELVLLYKKLNAAKNKCWCHALSKGKPVIAEIIMSISCNCSNEKILSKRHGELFVDLMFQNRPAVNWNREDIVQWLELEFERGVIYPASSLDLFRIDRIELTDVLRICPSGSVENVLCILTNLCGTSIKEIEWPKLLGEIKKLDNDLKEEFWRITGLCGFTFIRSISPASSHSDLEEERSIPTLNASIPEELETCLSLKSLCRLSVRRSVRQRADFMSMKDAIMSLYTIGIVPRSVVEYLLFRDVTFSEKAKSTKEHKITLNCGRKNYFTTEMFTALFGSSYSEDYHGTDYYFGSDYYDNYFDSYYGSDYDYYGSD